jgi:nitrile hydratase accessory protein
VSDARPQLEVDVELELDGPGAPPRANGEMVFEHPWQRRLFATTIALCQSGTIVYADFRDRLIAEVAEHPDEYWSSWQDALEGLLAQHGLCDRAHLSDRAKEFGEHAHPA